MIRLPPSVICLAPSDLLDYEDRRKERELENVKRQFARFEVGADHGPRFGRSREIEDSYDLPIRHTSGQGRLYPSFGGADSSEDQSGLSRIASPENTALEIHQKSSSPPKDAFHLGGFIDGPSQRSTDNTPHRSSPFAPDDVSTPQNLLPPTIQGYCSRTLPRSPLYLSHNASSSPERRPTSSLTPRVTSRVTSHNTPGYIFSHPPRRPATFRHQTNSFSFDSSERASAAYEQDRISSLSTTDSTTPRPPPGVRLRDELRGSSLSSSQVPTETDELQPQYLEEADDEVSDVPVQDGLSHGFIFSSPGFSLPPPFSTSTRTVSDALPSAPDQSPGNNSNGLNDSRRQSPMNHSPELSERTTRLEASPIRSPSRSSDPSTEINHPRRHSPINYSPTLNESHRSSPMQILRSGAARIVSYYRPRSPSRNQNLQALIARYPETPSRSLSVYNDELPPEAQPQTPAHLPESRHQSRFHPAYTAPVTRSRSGLFSANNPDIVPGRTVERRRRAPATPSRATRDRAASPVGLQNGGFQGLYGGRENGDEEQQWVDGVRFTNAEVRLWGLRDAANDGRNLGDTPEREEWRVGRH